MGTFGLNNNKQNGYVIAEQWYQGRLIDSVGLAGYDVNKDTEGTLEENLHGLQYFWNSIFISTYHFK